MAQVVESARAGVLATDGIGGPGDSYHEQVLRYVRDEFHSIDLNTWDGVSAAYHDGHLTGAQFRELCDAYMSGSQTSDEAQA